MTAQQRGSCRNAGAEKQRDDQLFYLPPSYPFFSSFGPFLISSAGGKAHFWALLLLPYFPQWKEIKMLIYGLAFGLFLMASSREVTLFSACQVGCTTGAALKVSGAKSWSSTQLETLHRDRNHRAGGGSTRNETSARGAREGARVWSSHSAVGGKPEGAQGYTESCKSRTTHAFL